MLGFTAITVLTFAAFGFATAGKLDACDVPFSSTSAIHLQGPWNFASNTTRWDSDSNRSLVTPSERLLAELDNETNVDLYVRQQPNESPWMNMNLNSARVHHPIARRVAATSGAGNLNASFAQSTNMCPGHVAEKAPITNGV